MSTWLVSMVLGLLRRYHAVVADGGTRGCSWNRRVGRAICALLIEAGAPTATRGVTAIATTVRGSLRGCGQLPEYARRTSYLDYHQICHLAVQCTAGSLRATFRGGAAPTQVPRVRRRAHRMAGQPDCRYRVATSGDLLGNPGVADWLHQSRK